MNPVIKFRRLHPQAVAPAYKTAEAAGADLCALLPKDLTYHLDPGCRAKIPTGLALEIPPGYEGQVRSRSGLADRHGVTVLNSPGTIDSDYRGELCVLLINHGHELFEIKAGDRIAQLVVAPVERASWQEAGELSQTERGAGGFGSTGKS